MALRAKRFRNGVFRGGAVDTDADAERLARLAKAGAPVEVYPDACGACRAMTYLKSACTCHDALAKRMRLF